MNDLFESVILAMLRELFKNRPEAVLVALQEMVSKLEASVAEFFVDWYNSVKDREEWPGFPGQPNPNPQGPPTSDPFQP